MTKRGGTVWQDIVVPQRDNFEKNQIFRVINLTLKTRRLRSPRLCPLVTGAVGYLALEENKARNHLRGLLEPGFVPELSG